MKPYIYQPLGNVRPRVKVADLLVCVECGALVAPADRKRHDDFHNLVDRLLVIEVAPSEVMTSGDAPEDGEEEMPPDDQ